MDAIAVLQFLSKLLSEAGAVFGGIVRAWNEAADVLLGLLAVLGGLKVIARYTRWSWDDALLAFVEKPVKWLASKIRRPNGL